MLTLGQGYSVAFDPLDGSSIIDTNFAVGTIFGVWPGSRLVGVTGRGLAAAGMAVYGPRTTMTVAGEVKCNGVRTLSGCACGAFWILNEARPLLKALS